MKSPIQDLAPALEIDARLVEIERDVNVLLNTTPVNAAQAWADFERSDFGTVPTLRLRPLDFEPDLLLRDLYDLEVENVTDPALHTLFRAKRDEIARQVTALEDRDTSRFLYGSLQLSVPTPGASRPVRSRRRLGRSSIDTGRSIQTSRPTSRCVTTSQS